MTLRGFYSRTNNGRGQAGFKRLLFIGAYLVGSGCDRFSRPAFAESGVWSSGTAQHVVLVGGVSRSFLLHVPPSIQTNAPISNGGRALLIALHGSGGDGGAMRALTHLDALADREDLLVAYPDGYRGLRGSSESTWNAGTCCGEAARDRIDDVAFVLSVVDTISARIKVDSRRIYVLGFSDGGRMAYRLACAASERITAFAVVAGSLRFGGCAPTASAPLIAFHGTADPSVLFNERSELLPVQSIDGAIPPSVAVWATRQQCSTPTRSDAELRVTRHSFTDCRLGDVVFYSIESGEHAWPKFATQTIVTFFLQHTK